MTLCEAQIWQILESAEDRCWVEELGVYTITRQNSVREILNDTRLERPQVSGFICTEERIEPYVASKERVPHFWNFFKYSTSQDVFDAMVRRLVVHAKSAISSSRVDEIVASLLSSVSDDVPFDLIQTIIEPSTARLFGEVIGLNEEASLEATELCRDINVVVGQVIVDKSSVNRAEAALQKLCDLVRKHEASVLSSAAFSKVQRKGSSSTTVPAYIDPDMVASAVFAFLGPLPRTTGNLLALLLEGEERYGDLFPNAVEKKPTFDEIMRLHGPTCIIPRFATKDVDAIGLSFLEGDVIHCLVSSANRDGQVFDYPDVFMAERHNAGRHLSFGAGTHRCPGIELTMSTMGKIAASLQTWLCKRRFEVCDVQRTRNFNTSGVEKLIIRTL